MQHGRKCIKFVIWTFVKLASHEHDKNTVILSYLIISYHDTNAYVLRPRTLSDIANLVFRAPPSGRKSTNVALKKYWRVTNLTTDINSSLMSNNILTIYSLLSCWRPLRISLSEVHVHHWMWLLLPVSQTLRFVATSSLAWTVGAN